MEVKICGMTHPEDATLAAELGADYIGIIFASRSKRQVSVARAKEIAHAARESGAQPVGVFEEQTAAEVLAICKETGIQMIQAPSTVTTHFPLICAISVAMDGSYSKSLPANACPLFDCLGGGTGTSFDWTRFSPPKNTPWILAGGLNPKNVAHAIALLKPSGVDVASGVELPNSTRKCPRLMEAFIRAAKEIL